MQKDHFKTLGFQDANSGSGFNLWLIRFEYLEYCQGWEDTYEYALVYAHTVQEACKKIAAKYDSAKNFRNLTIF